MVGFYSRTVLFSDNRAVAYLGGELDAYNITCLTARLAPIAVTGRDIIVDLAALSFLGTAGLMALADLQHHATASGGSLRLTEPPRLLRSLFDLAGMKDTFAIVAPAQTPDAL